MEYYVEVSRDVVSFSLSLSAWLLCDDRFRFLPFLRSGEVFDGVSVVLDRRGAKEEKTESVEFSKRRRGDDVGGCESCLRPPLKSSTDPILSFRGICKLSRSLTSTTPLRGMLEWSRAFTFSRFEDSSVSFSNFSLVLYYPLRFRGP